MDMTGPHHIATALAEIPLIDAEVIDPFLELAGAVVFARTAEGFWEENAALFAAIGAATDPDARKQAAHTAKGAAATLGAARLAALAEALERPDADVQAWLSVEPDVTMQSREALEKYLSAWSPGSR